MITIKYDPNGLAIADNLAENFVKEIKTDTTVSVSTSNVVETALTMVISDGLEVQFEYNGETLIPNEYGALHNWPSGFCDLIPNLTFKRISLAMQKRKENLNNVFKAPLI